MSSENYQDLGAFIENISITYDFNNKDKVVFLNTSDIYDGKVINHNWTNISDLPGQAKKSIKKEDILFSEIRPANRRFAMVDFDTKNYVISTKIMVIRPKNGILKNYLYLCLTNNETLKYLQFLAESRSGTFPQITFEQIQRMKVYIPSIDEQKKIIQYAMPIISKIELNSRVNKILEEIAQAIFKRWFIDFEFPNENGKPYESSGGEMVDSELVSIPKRWKIIRLDKLIKRNKQKIKNMKDWENKKLIDLSVMPRFSFCVNNFEKGSKLKTNIYKLNKFDILFGSIRPYFGKAGFSPINGVVAGTIFSYLPVRENLYSYILCLTTSKSFIDFTVKYSRGTKMPIIHWDDFVSYKVVVPEDDKLLESFNNMIMPLLKEIKENINMNQDLSDMRDILLSKLMSGEIRVPINNKNFNQLK